MRTLPDMVYPGMSILFVGTNPGEKSARIGHYFAGKSNMFWKLLYESGLTPERLYTETDHKIREYGYGLTDVIKRPTRSTSDLGMGDSAGSDSRLDAIISEYRPGMVAFVGKTGFRHYTGEHQKPLEYGRQMMIGGSEAFLMPSTSGQSYADTKYDEKLYWYRHLREQAGIMRQD